MDPGLQAVLGEPLDRGGGFSGQSPCQGRCEQGRQDGQGQGAHPLHQGLQGKPHGYYVRQTLLVCPTLMPVRNLHFLVCTREHDGDLPSQITDAHDGCFGIGTSGFLCDVYTCPLPAVSILGYEFDGDLFCSGIMVDRCVLVFICIHVLRINCFESSYQMDFCGCTLDLHSLRGEIVFKLLLMGCLVHCVLYANVPLSVRCLPSRVRVFFFCVCSLGFTLR